MEIEDISTLSELMEKIKKPNISNAYHYTNLSSLFYILNSKSLKFSSMEVMNDVFEKKLFSGCKDLFFCLSKNTLVKENFGMWAMYGKLSSKVPAVPDNAENIGVKIFFPKFVLDELCKTKSLNLHSVAYTNLRENYKDGSLKKYIIGTQTVKKEIEFHIKDFSGYLKDSAWSYENELRLRIRNFDVMKESCSVELSDKLISKLIVYPSPYYSADECRDILIKKGYKGNVNIQENIYRKTYANPKELVK